MQRGPKANTTNEGIRRDMKTTPFADFTKKTDPSQGIDEKKEKKKKKSSNQWAE